MPYGQNPLVWLKVTPRVTPRVPTCGARSPNFCFWQDDRPHREGIINLFFITCDDGLHEVWVVVWTVQFALSNFHAEFPLLLPHHCGDEFRRHFPHVYKSSVKMECSNSVFIPTSWTISWPVTRWYSMIICLTILIRFSFRLVECLPGHASFSLEVQSCLKKLYHFMMWALLMNQSSKACRTFLIVGVGISKNVWHNLMLFLCSMCSVKKGNLATASSV